MGGHKGGRPRGVLFLAGPTGVGKTELAKTVTQLLFGDEALSSALICLNLVLNMQTNA
ncbi:hypothetical protein MASR2M36_37160 [Providencia sp.]